MLANLRALFGVIADIILLKRGPESLPASSGLLAIVMALFVGVSALVASQSLGREAAWPIDLALGTTFLFVWFRLALQIARKPERFLQTATALFSVRALFAPVLIPVGAAMGVELQHPETASLALALLMLALYVWLFAIQVHIVRAAFDWNLPKAAGFVLLQDLAAILLFALVLGVPEKSA